MAGPHGEIPLQEVAHGGQAPLRDVAVLPQDVLDLGRLRVEGQPQLDQPVVPDDEERVAVLQGHEEDGGGDGQRGLEHLAGVVVGEGQPGHEHVVVGLREARLHLHAGLEDLEGLLGVHVHLVDDALGRVHEHRVVPQLEVDGLLVLLHHVRDAALVRQAVAVHEEVVDGGVGHPQLLQHGLDGPDRPRGGALDHLHHAVA